MRVALLEPFFTGSHQKWAKSFQKYSQHPVDIYSLPGRHWKWRMHVGAPALAKQVNNSDSEPDLFFATDMLDVAVFRALLKPSLRTKPIAVYFHENQITYPWSPSDKDPEQKRDLHYGFINFTSALAGDKLFFNSNYHRQSFLSALPHFLNKYPDYNQLDSVSVIESKSEVLHLGMDLGPMDQGQTEPEQKRAVLLWNHRWEYDKNPNLFFETLFTLQDRGVDFRLVVLGEQFENSPEIFAFAKERLKEKLLHFGYADSFEDYCKWLSASDIALVTSNQDFFGGSVVEAMYMNVLPLLPKRLAYPEHIPEALHNTFFYENKEEIANKLQRLIFNVNVIRKQSVRKFVEHYDWGIMAPKYDHALENLTSEIS